VLRKRIEEHFEDVKEATETHEAPTLPQHLVEWIAVHAAAALAAARALRGPPPRDSSARARRTALAGPMRRGQRARARGATLNAHKARANCRLPASIQLTHTAGAGRGKGAGTV
jgi:hypothetical protein